MQLPVSARASAQAAEAMVCHNELQTKILATHPPETADQDIQWSICRWPRVWRLCTRGRGRSVSAPAPCVAVGRPTTNCDKRAAAVLQGRRRGDAKTPPLPYQYKRYKPPPPPVADACAAHEAPPKAAGAQSPRQRNAPLGASSGASGGG